MEFPSRADVAAIVALPDPVRRNRAITACYLQLGRAVAALLGGDDVNWLVFGAWASGSAGRVIDGTALPIDLGTSQAVAEGNRAIIADVAPRFVRWLEEVARAGGPTSTALDVALSDQLFDRAPGLVAGLLAYQQAVEARALAGVTAPDWPAGAGLFPAGAAKLPAEVDAEIAQLVLLGNVQVAAHEQWLADHLIDEAMPLGGLFGRITTRFVEVWTPDGPLDVCRDVPCPGYLQGRRWPAALDQLTLPSLCELVGGFDHALDGSSPSRAETWECFEDRMGYIVAFFRAHARDTRFLELPVEFLDGGQP